MTKLTDVCNFADDTTFHACNSSLEDLVNRLEHDANLAIDTARKTIFLRSWNIIESSKRPRKYHLSINFLTLKKDRISNHQKVQKKNFPVISKHHIFVNFLAQEKTVFPISKKAKTRTFQ